MRHQTVNKKFPPSMLVFALAVATFIASWAQLFPSRVVESVYSRLAFPTISYMFSFAADAVPFSWLDAFILGGIVILLYGLRKRKWKVLAGLVSVFYLWFFWTWGLNYHRLPLAGRLHLEQTNGLTDPELKRFAAIGERTGIKING